MQKDPLRDNRIFPEEMQEQPERSHAASSVPLVRFLRTLMIIVILGIIAFFVYQFFTTAPATEESDWDYETRLDFYTQTQAQHPPIDLEDRAERIQFLFESFNQQ